jgi:phosphomannomutase
MDPSIFKAYDIRGIYPDQLNEEDAWKIGCATTRFLIDTPQMYFAINHFGTCGGVQVTASHNPAKYNGFKISGLDAKPIGGDTGLKDIEHIAMALLHTKGKVTGSVESHDVTAEYKKHVLKFLRPNVKKMKIAVDASNGMAGKMVPALFGKLPVQIIELNFKHDGTFKHEPNPLVEKYLAEVKAAVKKNKCDFGVCFDGDADRLMMIDEKGNTIGCDLMTALMVPYFLEKKPKSTVVYDLRSSRVVAEEIIKHGGTPRRERVGHAYMKKAMRDSHSVFGGELSGHFYYRDNFYADSGMITLVHVINIVSEANVPISELISPLRRYHSSGEMNFTVENKQAKMDELARRYRDGQIDHLDGVAIRYKDWWFNCRPSNTEPLLRLNVEAESKELLDEKLSEMTGQIGEPV